MNNKRNILNDILIVFTGNITTMIFGFLSGIVLSRVLGPELKGEYVSLLVVPGIIASISVFGTRQSAIHLIGTKIYSNGEVITAFFYLMLFSSLTGIGFFLMYFYLYRFENISILMLSLVIAYIPLRLATIYTGSIFLANLQFKKANFYKWFAAFLIFVGILVFVYFMKLSITGALLGLCIGTLIMVAAAVFQVLNQYGATGSFKLNVIKRLAGEGLFYAIAMLVIQLNYRIDIILLDSLSEKNEIGFYAVGVSVAEKLWQLPFAIGVVLLSRSAHSKDLKLITDEVAKMLRIALILVLISSLILYFIVPYIVPLIYGQAFTKSSLIVQHILPGIIFFVIVRIISSSLAGMGKPLLIIWVFLPALILNIILNLVFIPAYGSIGAAWATNFSYFSGGFMLLVIYARQTRTSLKKYLVFQKDDFRLLKNFRDFRKQSKLIKNQRGLSISEE